MLWGLPVLDAGLFVLDKPRLFHTVVVRPPVRAHHPPRCPSVSDTRPSMTFPQVTPRNTCATYTILYQRRGPSACVPGPGWARGQGRRRKGPRQLAAQGRASRGSCVHVGSGRRQVWTRPTACAPSGEKAARGGRTEKRCWEWVRGAAPGRSVVAKKGGGGPKS